MGFSSVEDLIESSTGGYDLIYIDPPFGLQREFHMTEADGSKKSFQDSWANYDDYIEWLAETINGLYDLLKKDGWLYSHNNFEGNALVLGKVDKRVRRSFYTNISWLRSHPKNNIRIGWGNIVDSIMVLRKGKPFFDVEYSPLDPPTPPTRSVMRTSVVGTPSLQQPERSRGRVISSSTMAGHRPSVGATLRRRPGYWMSRD